MLSGEVECDAVYVIADHKGTPGAVKKDAGVGGDALGGTIAKDKPPIFGTIQRGGAVVIRLVENVQQKTIRPLIETFIAPGTRVRKDSEPYS